MLHTPTGELDLFFGFLVCVLMKSLELGSPWCLVIESGYTLGPCFSSCKARIRYQGSSVEGPRPRASRVQH